MNELKGGFLSMAATCIRDTYYYARLFPIDL